MTRAYVCVKISEYSPWGSDPSFYFLSFFSAIRRDDVCDAGFGATIEDDMKKIKSIDFSMAAPYLKKLKPIGNPEIFFHKNGVEIPVMATAASSNHYDEAGMLIENLNTVVRPAYPSMQLYFFDIGLKDWQREQVRSYTLFALYNHLHKRIKKVLSEGV